MPKYNDVILYNYFCKKEEKLATLDKKSPINITNILSIITIACIVSMIFFLINQKVRNTNSTDFIEPVEISKNIEITDSEGNKKIVDLPYTINTNCSKNYPKNKSLIIIYCFFSKFSFFQHLL